MIPFAGQAVLLDIEGTTSSISFVYDVMFPFVRKHVSTFITEQWDDDELKQTVAQMAMDQGVDLASWLNDSDPGKLQQAVVEHVLRLMDSDAKTTGLKSLQGQIWKSGFQSGELVGHLFPDVAPAIQRWKLAGLRIYIYSSGSIAAQKLYFANSQSGNLLPFLEGHFDTTIGGKKEATSYTAIASQIGILPREVLFISDIVEELDAARQVGMNTAYSIRPGNHTVECDRHPSMDNFGQIEIARCCSGST